MVNINYRSLHFWCVLVDNVKITLGLVFGTPPLPLPCIERLSTLTLSRENKTS